MRWGLSRLLQLTCWKLVRYRPNEKVLVHIPRHFTRVNAYSGASRASVTPHQSKNCHTSYFLTGPTGYLVSARPFTNWMFLVTLAGFIYPISSERSSGKVSQTPPDVGEMTHPGSLCGGRSIDQSVQSLQPRYPGLSS